MKFLQKKLLFVCSMKNNPHFKWLKFNFSPNLIGQIFKFGPFINLQKSQFSSFRFETLNVLKQSKKLCVKSFSTFWKNSWIIQLLLEHIAAICYLFHTTYVLQLRFIIRKRLCKKPWMQFLWIQLPKYKQTVLVNIFWPIFRQFTLAFATSIWECLEKTEGLYGQIHLFRLIKV